MDEAGRAHGHVEALCRELRFPGSEGEKRAAAYILEKCSLPGVRAESMEFQVYRFPDQFFTRIMLSLWGIILLGALLFFQSCTPAATALLLIMSLSVAYLSRWQRLFENLFDIPAGEAVASSNVRACIDSCRDGAPTIVLMAHYDSKSQNLPIYLRAFVMIGGTMGMAALLVISIAALFCRAFTAGIPALFFYAGGALVAISILVMFFNRSVNESPGAMDNATGVAVLLELVSHFQGNPPPGVNLHFLFTSAEEIGLCGAFRYLQAHGGAYDRRSTRVINLDGVGGREKLLIVDRYSFPEIRTARALGKVAERCALSLGIPLHRPLLLMGALWDHVVWASRGYEAITLSMGGWEKATLLIHSREDRVEHINPQALRRTAELVKAMISEIAAGATGNTKGGLQQDRTRERFS